MASSTGRLGGRHAWVFGSAFLVGFSGAMMPGPMLAATIGGALQRGPWSGPRVVLGHAIVEIVLVALLAFGRGTWLRRPIAFRVIAIVGGLLLLLMGADMLRKSAQAMTVLLGTGSDARNNDVLAGVLTSVSNPYFFLWWGTVGLAMIQDAHARGTSAGIFFGGHILSDLVWFSLVAFVVARSRSLAALPEHVFALLYGGCGIALLGLGLWFVVSGLRQRINRRV